MKCRTTHFHQFGDKMRDAETLVNPVVLAMRDSETLAEILASPKLLEPGVIVRVELSVELTTEKELDDHGKHLLHLCGE